MVKKQQWIDEPQHSFNDVNKPNIFDRKIKSKKLENFQEQKIIAEKELEKGF